MKSKHISAAVLAAVMMTAAVPFTASADETQSGTKHVVILGDGVAAGAGLAEGARSYAEQLSTYLGAETISFAQDDYTTEDVLACLERADVQAALSEADVILVSAGLNDFFIPYTALANQYMEEFGLESFSELYTTTKAELGLTDAELLRRSNSLGDVVRNTKNGIVSNILAIGETLSQYQEAKVIYLNVYHPMNNLEDYNSLSAGKQLAYDMGVLNPIDGILTDRNSINPTYSSLAETYPCTVIDCYTLFAGEAYKYAHPADLNPYLNSDGQDLLAVETAFDSGLFVYGDLDGDEDATATDAALLLKHAALTGSGNPGILNAIQRAASDVNFDGEPDATDAATILKYAALKGAGVSVSFSDLAKE